jgi:2-dehydro-3-deoxyphosphogluconate aldolase / (4S)-4-hydroxy-2-oxoglutarate aldolase
LNKTEILKQISEIGLIPVIRVQTVDLAHRAISAIRDGGVPIIEITMTVPGAMGIIENLRQVCGAETIIGAGTVLDPETARGCIQAGAQFIVSPALNPDTIACCKEHGIVVIPGALTPTEVVSAWELGADLVKIFPAGSVGGASYLKALKGPLPHIKMVPTGGVTLKTAESFIEAGAEALGVGADLVDVAALEARMDQRITERAEQFLEIVRKARVYKTSTPAEGQEHLHASTEENTSAA